jgi:hypothetical protein
MSKNKRWSKDEDAVLFRAVAEQPNNLQKAFLAVSRTTGRTVSATRQHWYDVLCKNPDKANVAFVTVSKKKKVVNGKNKPATPVKKSLWSKILNLFK